MTKWERYTVEIAGETVDVEARLKESGELEWRGLPGTTLATWQGGAPRTNQSVAQQVQDAALYWYETYCMK